MRLALLPVSTNKDYRGSPWASMFLGLLGLLTIGPGVIHYFLPDGGAGVIAGLDLSDTAGGRPAIVGVFAWEGATQLAFGAAMAIVAWRYRTLVALFLLLSLIETALQAAAEWLFKPGAPDHHPPGSYGVLIAMPIIVLMLVLSLLPQRGWTTKTMSG